MSYLYSRWCDEHEYIYARTGYVGSDIDGIHNSLLLLFKYAFFDWGFSADYL